MQSGRRTRNFKIPPQRPKYEGVAGDSEDAKGAGGDRPRLEGKAGVVSKHLDDQKHTVSAQPKIGRNLHRLFFEWPEQNLGLAGVGQSHQEQDRLAKGLSA